MYDCSRDVLAFHNDAVTLSEKGRGEMRERRDANRNRIRKSLVENEKPTPLGFRSQGSYAMRTMVQESNKDYDIDDGLYFKKEDLVGPKGGEMTSLQVRQMVYEAAIDDSFNAPPEPLKNCVRVYYNDGSHVDIPSYREVRTKSFGDVEHVHYELASSSWKESDPIAVNEWFKNENKNQSPDLTNGRQLRRIVRLLKKFARSRESWKSRIATGFMITKLVTERYIKDDTLDDVSLRQTMNSIKDRLELDLEIRHPVLDEFLTNGSDDSRAMFLLEKLKWALDKLDVLDDNECTEKQALETWDKVFNTDFFSKRGSSSDANKSGGGPVSAGILLENCSDREPRQTDKNGGGRYGGKRWA